MAEAPNVVNPATPSHRESLEATQKRQRLTRQIIHSLLWFAFSGAVRS